MGERCEHGIKPASECPECSDRAAAVHAGVEASYAQGRADERAAVVAWLRGADERAAIVAWLRGLPAPLERVEYLAQAIERGCHEHEKEKP